jgi:exodeoxyribonuclease V alpha subunit
VIPLALQHYLLLERNLLYTGVTRGKKLVVLIAQKKALAMAVKSVRSRKRITCLAERLVAKLPALELERGRAALPGAG